MQPRVHSHAAASTSAAAAAAAPAPAAARAAARLPRGQRRPLLLRRPVRAAGLPEGVDSVLTTGTLVASGLAILGSAALSLRAPPPRQQLPPGEADSGSSSSGSQLQRQQQQQREEEEEEGLGTEYGIMGIISCIPLVNWTAWMLPALTQPDRAALYWAYCVLYATPLLRNGFDIDGYVVAMVVLGALHVQVERIALTEPDVLREAQPLRLVLQTTLFLLEKGYGFGTSLLGVLASDSQRIAQGREGDDSLLRDATRGRKELQPPDDEDESSSGEYELKEFDRRMLERARRQGREGQAREGGRRQQQQQQQQQPRSREGSDEDEGPGGGGRQ